MSNSLSPESRELGMLAWPRGIWIAGRWVSSFKLLLCIALQIGILASTALAAREGLRILPYGIWATVCALAAVAGTRVYFLMMAFGRRQPGKAQPSFLARNQGGGALFGSLLFLVPLVLISAWWLGLHPGTLADMHAFGILAGGFWARLGCVLNGCCGGRETSGPLGVHLHDERGVRKRRIPVQFLEMGWWVLGAVIFLVTWPLRAPAGSYALGMLTGYGVVRFFLEGWRERSDTLGKNSRVRLQRVVAAALALIAGTGLLLRLGLP